MGQLFRREVLEQRQQRLSGEVSLIQPPVFKTLGLLLVVITTVSLVFLSLAEYTRKETVTGILQPDGGIIRLAAPQQGMITEVLISEGQQVEQGQPLLRIRSEKQGLKGFELNQSLINQYQFQLNSLRHQQSQQLNKQQLEIQALEDQKHNLTKQRSALEQQSLIYTKRLKLNQQINTQIGVLAGTGYVSEVDLKKQQDSLMALDQQAAGVESQKLTLDQQIEQLKNQLVQLPLTHAQANEQWQNQINQTQGQLDGIRQQQVGELRAPIAGVVSGLLANVGKMVSPEQNMLSILPAGSVMEAVLYVPTSAFGFIHQGQTTRLRYHAFPYQRFGIAQGQIKQISTHVILPAETDIPGIIQQPSYRVVVRIESQTISAYGRDMPLRSGMKLDADIVIEQRSLMRWLFDPIFSLQG